MKHIFDGNNYLIKLEKGEELVSSLTGMIKEEQITSGWISGLGGLQSAELGIYSLGDRNYKWQKFDGPLELSGLTGNIAWSSNEPILHMHGTVSGMDLMASMGHLKQAVVAGTVEIFISRLQWHDRIIRSQDDETGLKLLDL